MGITYNITIANCSIKSAGIPSSAPICPIAPAIGLSTTAMVILMRPHVMVIPFSTEGPCGRLAFAYAEMFAHSSCCWRRAMSEAMTMSMFSQRRVKPRTTRSVTRPLCRGWYGYVSGLRCACGAGAGTVRDSRTSLIGLFFACGFRGCWWCRNWLWVRCLSQKPVPVPERYPAILQISIAEEVHSTFHSCLQEMHTANS